ncbi:MAG: formate-dependent phosphoribosylglycinamide formyltransferase [Candidatus Nanohalarchaeota archaeon]|nr:MAG: formate-dependent phosphoribosylglycinamide formyltransferase [Candidatus Nanohaloarchaeota archaeon]
MNINLQLQSQLPLNYTKRDILTSPCQTNSCKILLLGSGELGREVIIQAQRLGMATVAVDRYENAPAQQVAHKSYTIDMLDGDAVRHVVELEKPSAIVCEIEAINLDMLMRLEKEGWPVRPNAKAVWITMNRERSRDMIAKAGVPTSKYIYVDTEDADEFKKAVEKMGYPCVSKAIMSSSGHGSYFIKTPKDIEPARLTALKDARGSGTRAIIEEYIDFDTEVTELAVRHLDENGKIVTSFPRPIGHYQIDGDYHASWQSPNVTEYLPWKPEDVGSKFKPDEDLAKKAERKIYKAAKKITGVLGGLGVFGVELFVKAEDGKVQVLGNECSPRPHDTGMVTFMSHMIGMNEGALHLRAISGLPVPARTNEDGYRIIDPIMPASSHVIKAGCGGWDPEFRGIWNAGNTPGVNVYLFGKPNVSYDPKAPKDVHRRLGITLAMGKNVLDAKNKAEVSAHKIEMRTRQFKKWITQDNTLDARKKHLQ